MALLFRNKYRVESTRFKDYDYSFDGAYFITICTKNKEHYFGEIVNGELQGTEQSKICLACWLNLPNHYNNCILDAFVIMPNHVHMIIFIENKRFDYKKCFYDYKRFVETGLKPVSTTTGNGKCVYDMGLKPVSTTAGNRKCVYDIGLKPVSTTTGNGKCVYSISEIIRGFKTFTARKINIFENIPGRQFWQTRFYDRIIRNEDELNRIRKYIYNNPYNWENDRNSL